MFDLAKLLLQGSQRAENSCMTSQARCCSRGVQDWTPHLPSTGQSCPIKFQEVPHLVQQFQLVWYVLPACFLSS